MLKKYGEGKIISVIDEEELTEKQKKDMKDLFEKSANNDKPQKLNKTSGDN